MQHTIPAQTSARSDEYGNTQNVNCPRKTLDSQVINISKPNPKEFNDAAKKIVNAQPVLIYPVVPQTKIQYLVALKAGTGSRALVTFRAIYAANIGSDKLFKTSN